MSKRLFSLLCCGLLGYAGTAATSIAAEPPTAAEEMAPSITQTELLARIGKQDPDLVVLDVRTPAEFAAGHVPGARNLSHDLLSSKLAELGELRDKQVVLYCRSGRRSLLAEDTLRKAGFTKLLHLQGDYLAWEAEHRPIEK
ncbi:MAG: rhodanese-like domain-containing protein [Pseudomonadota bacterium]